MPEAIKHYDQCMVGKDHHHNGCSSCLAVNVFGPRRDPCRVKKEIYQSGITAFGKSAEAQFVLSFHFILLFYFRMSYVRRVKRGGDAVF